MTQCFSHTRCFVLAGNGRYKKIKYFGTRSDTIAISTSPGVGVVVPQLGGVVQVDAAIGAPPARTTFGHFRPRTALPAGLPRPGNQLVCAFAGMNSKTCSRIPFLCACCLGMGWDAGWCMLRTHSAAPHAHRLLARSTLSCLLQLSWPAVGRGHFRC